MPAHSQVCRISNIKLDVIGHREIHTYGQLGSVCHALLPVLAAAAPLVGLVSTYQQELRVCLRARLVYTNTKACQAERITAALRCEGIADIVDAHRSIQPILLDHLKNLECASDLKNLGVSIIRPGNFNIQAPVGYLGI